MQLLNVTIVGNFFLFFKNTVRSITSMIQLVECRRDVTICTYYSSYFKWIAWYRLHVDNYSVPSSLKTSNVWYFWKIKKSYKRCKIFELSFDTILLKVKISNEHHFITWKKNCCLKQLPLAQVLAKMILHVVELKMEMQEIFLHLQAYLKKNRWAGFIDIFIHTKWVILLNFPTWISFLCLDFSVW